MDVNSTVQLGKWHVLCLQIVCMGIHMVLLFSFMGTIREGLGVVLFWSKANFSFQFMAGYVWYSMEKLASDLLFGFNACWTINSPNTLHTLCLAQVERLEVKILLNGLYWTCTCTRCFQESRCELVHVHTLSHDMVKLIYHIQFSVLLLITNDVIKCSKLPVEQGA